MAIERFQSPRHSFASRVYYKAHHDWARRKIFKIKVLRGLENAILRLVLANTINTSFDYTFFQLFYKHYVAFHSSKLPGLAM